jgi:hypothetical protein
MKWNSSMIVFIALVFFASCGYVQNGRQALNSETTQQDQQAPDYSNREISPNSKREIQSLVSTRDIAGLLTIVNEDGERSCEAIIELMYLMKPSEAVKFCSSFEYTDGRWFVAFDCVSSLPKTEAINYLKQVVTSPESWLRGMCYRSCLQAGWDDLIACASRDCDNETLVGFPNQPHDEHTVGDIAKKYIAACNKVSTILQE